MKNRLCRINNVRTVVFTTFNCYLLYSASKKALHKFQGKVTGVGRYRCEQEYTLAGNNAGKSGVAAETVELVQFPWCVCFPIQGSVYSLFTLFEDQALKLLPDSEFVLSCSGLDPRFLALRGPNTEVSSF